MGSLELIFASFWSLGVEKSWSGFDRNSIWGQILVLVLLVLILTDVEDKPFPEAPL